MISICATKSVHFDRTKWARTVNSCNALKEIIVVIYRDSSSSYIIACVACCAMLCKCNDKNFSFCGFRWMVKMCDSMKSRSIYISISIVCLARCVLWRARASSANEPIPRRHSIWLWTTKYVLFEIADLFIWRTDVNDDDDICSFLSLSSIFRFFFFCCAGISIVVC